MKGKHQIESELAHTEKLLKKVTADWTKAVYLSKIRTLHWVLGHNDPWEKRR